MFYVCLRGLIGCSYCMAQEINSVGSGTFEGMTASHLLLCTLSRTR